MSIKLIVRAALLLLLFGCASPCKAVASSVPWCAPEVALLSFKDQKGQEAAKVELRSVEPVCSVDGAEKAAGVSLERLMRIESDGQWLDVPRSCLSGVSFRLDELSLSIDHAGVGIKIIGKSTARGEQMTIVVYAIHNKILCAQG
jgi:hypothetical protein